MNSEERLAGIYDAMVRAGIRALVLGGHAVRFYGIGRFTLDYDFHIAGPSWDQLLEILKNCIPGGEASIAEAPSWRPRAFRRFIIGRLPDGREERIECWRENHLLPPFEELYLRRSEGVYGGKTVAFLGLKDLLRSKETEREDDWRDIELLEEILDERLRGIAISPEGRVEFLSSLRSRKGFSAAVRDGFFQETEILEIAWPKASHPVTRAFLSPFLPSRPKAGASRIASMIDEIIEVRLAQVEPASVRHLALVEAVRRLSKRGAMDADREDKIQQADQSRR